MEPKKLGPVIFGIVSAAGTSGVGIMISRPVSDQGITIHTCLTVVALFTITGLIAALRLILNYRLEKLTFRIRVSALQRDADLRTARLELQRTILDNIQDGTKASLAYQRMATADALVTPSRSSLKASP